MLRFNKLKELGIQFQIILTAGRRRRGIDWLFMECKARGFIGSIYSFILSARLAWTCSLVTLAQRSLPLNFLHQVTSAP